MCAHVHMHTPTSSLIHTHKGREGRDKGFTSHITKNSLGCFIHKARPPPQCICNMIVCSKIWFVYSNSATDLSSKQNYSSSVVFWKQWHHFWRLLMLLTVDCARRHSTLCATIKETGLAFLIFPPFSILYVLPLLF